MSTTVAEIATGNTVSFHAALMQAEAQARSTLDSALHARLNCAVALVKDGHVFQANDGTWQVDSTSKEHLTYTVNGTCGCEDHRYNHPPKGLCKHRLAMFLSQRVSTLMQQPLVPVMPEILPAPVTLPEARASLNFRAMVGNFEVQMTLRDETKGAILDRLQVLLKRHDIRPVPKPAPRSTGTWKRNQGR